MQAYDLSAIAEHLAVADRCLAPLIQRVGPPAIRGYSNPFLNLLCAIVNQQLSIKAAATIYGRLTALFPNRRPTPRLLLQLDPAQLRGCGLSGQKTIYARELAAAGMAGRLRPKKLAALDDEQVIAELTLIKGIGRWTAEMFLIFGMRRPDVLPVDDLGLVKGVQLLYGLRQRPDAARLRRIAEPWRPYRSFGTWYVWRSLANE